MNKNNKKEKEQRIVLSLFPNSLGFGFAVMENPLKVLDSQVVVVRPVSNVAVMKRIKQIIDYYRPTLVILEDYNGKGTHKSKRITSLIDKISQYAKKQNLPQKAYSRAHIRLAFSSFQAQTKHEISCVIARNIEFMAHKLKPKRKLNESEKYTAGAFDAVSLAITHFFLTD